MNRIFALAGIVIKDLYRRKDFYVLFVLTALLTMLAGSTALFDDKRISGYLKELCLALIWLATLVIALTTAARQIPAERESRTIFPLLAKPVTRWQVVVGKFLGSWLAAGIAVSTFYLFFGVVSAARDHTWPMAQYFQAAWLHWMMLGVVVAMAMLGSVLFSAPSVNITILFIVVGGILMVGQHLHKVALRLTEPGQTLLTIVYFCMPHLEWAFNYRDLLLFEQPLVSWGVLAGATGYWIAYMLAFLTAAWLVFQRRSLSVG